MKEITKTLDLMLDFGVDGRTLIPVVTQDYSSKEVLILSFANRQAFETTLETGYATYWSRSRDKLWTKGEESKNRLIVRDIRINCEQNSLLYLVEKEKGGACHVKDSTDEYYSGCFYRRVKDGRTLELI